MIARNYLSMLIGLILLGMTTVSPVLASSEAQGRLTIHHVNYGETLYYIAVLYGVSVEAILQHNNLVDPNQIYVGLELVIPNGSTRGTVEECTQYHLVQPGETLTTIAWIHGTTIQSLLQLNNLYNQNFIFTGQKICVTSASVHLPSDAPPQEAYYHTVTNNETLSDIAYKYGVDLWQIVQANNLVNADYVWAGQRLLIPGFHPEPHPRPKPPLVDQQNPVVVQTPIPIQTNSSKPSEAKPDETKMSETSSPSLSRSDEPLTIVVNGGQVWVGEITSAQPDAQKVNTLVVKTGGDEVKTIRLKSGTYQIEAKTEFDEQAQMFLIVFQDIPAGDYLVSLEDPLVPGQKSRVTLKEGERAEVTFNKEVLSDEQTVASPQGWRLASWTNPSKSGERLGGWSNIIVRAPASGYVVNLVSVEGGYHTKCITGSKGWNACEFPSLGASLYNLWIEGTDLTVQTYIDGSVYAEFTFMKQ
jgi:LysM repeat protein